MKTHFAANGRDFTACSIKRNAATSNRTPTCKACLVVLAEAQDLNVDALVATSEDGSTTSYREAFAAVLKAQNLAKRLGPGWTPHVFENLGWHWKVQFKTIRVWPSGAGGFCAYIGPVDGNIRWHASAKTLRAAINKVLKVAGKELDETREMVYDAAESIMDEGDR